MKRSKYAQIGDNHHDSKIIAARIIGVINEECIAYIAEPAHPKDGKALGRRQLYQKLLVNSYCHWLEDEYLRLRTGDLVEVDVAQGRIIPRNDARYMAGVLAKVRNNSTSQLEEAIE